jgi:hypothetical protein
MTTGADILKIYDREIDQAYTDFESTEQKTDRMRVAMVNVVERIYRSLDSQKDNDDIRDMIVVERRLELPQGELRLAPFSVLNAILAQNIPFGITTVTIETETPHLLQSDDLANLVFRNSSASGLGVDFNSVSWSILSPTQLQAIFPVLISGTYNQGSVLVYSSRTTVGNYSHLIAVKPEYYHPMLPKLSKIVAVSGSKIRFLFSTPLRTGDKIRVKTSPVIQAYETDYYVQRLNVFEFELYMDEALTMPASLSSIPKTTKYSVFFAISEYAEKASPHELVSRFIGAYEAFPGYLIDSNKIIFRPKSPAPESALLSYIRSDIEFFDLGNSTKDYEAYYSRKFIQRVIDEAVSDFNRSVRDFNALGAENNQIMTNP